MGGLVSAPSVCSCSGVLPFCSCGCYMPQCGVSAKTCVVTGANQGIGLETARALAKKGYHVIILARSEEKGAAGVSKIKASCAPGMKGANVEYLVCDLSDLSQVHDCGRELEERQLTLHALVNNAGIMNTPYSTSVDGYEMQFATNHLGHFLLTLLLVPSLVRSKGRVVNLSSVAHYGGSPYMEHLRNAYEGGRRYSAWHAYSVSKNCNILFTYELHRRLHEYGVTVNAAHPGVIRSALWKHMGGVDMCLLKGPRDGAKPSIYAASGGCRNSGSSGLFYVPTCCWTGHQGTDPSTYYPDLQAELWDLSLDLVSAFLPPGNMGVDEHGESGESEDLLAREDMSGLHPFLGKSRARGGGGGGGTERCPCVVGGEGLTHCYGPLDCVNIPLHYMPCCYWCC